MASMLRDLTLSIPVRLQTYHLSVVCLVVVGLWIVLTVVCRLYFSPIAHFPGPKLAALTQWYEAYYDLWLNGQFTLHLKTLHEQYGPIVRINPWELHIDDPEFYETIYSTTSAFDKVPAHVAWSNVPRSSVQTISHELHRMRRSAQNSLFSKRQISGFAPEVQGRAEKLCHRINTEYKGTGKVLQLDDAWGCFTTDIVTEYVFAREYKYLDSPGFQAPFVKTLHTLAKAYHPLRLFSWILPMMLVLPEGFVRWASPGMGDIFEFKKDIGVQIEDIKRGRNAAHKDASHPTVFNELLNSSLPAEEKKVARLQDEGNSIVAAGIETTRWTLCVATFHLLDKPDMARKLRKELLGIWPDVDHPPRLQELEKLTYLSAVIQEALRFGVGASSRLPRTSRNPLEYHSASGLSYTIPPGTPFSMSIVYMHQNSTLFPAPHIFDPSRWLPDPVTGKISTGPGGKALSRYLVPFAKGTRMCLGMHLAYAELYIGLANLFRRCHGNSKEGGIEGDTGGLRLWETTELDVAMWSDQFLPHPHPDTKGVRVLVS